MLPFSRPGKAKCDADMVEQLVYSQLRRYTPAEIALQNLVDVDKKNKQPVHLSLSTQFEIHD